MPTFKEHLESGRPLLGTFLQIPAAEMAEIVGHAGLDFGIIDAEHGMLGVDVSIQMVRGCDSVGLATVYRVPKLDPHRIGHALDIGASAVMVPNVTNCQEAEQAIQGALYHPLGMRGVCPFARGAGYNAVDERPDYYNEANREVAVVLQIEGQAGLANVDSILEVQGIDALFIGPFDLSQSLGIPGQVTDPRVLEGIRQIVQKAGAKGIAVGNFAVTPEQAHKYLEIGVRFVAYGVDSMVVARAYRDLKRDILP